MCYTFFPFFLLNSIGKGANFVILIFISHISFFVSSSRAISCKINRDTLCLLVNIQGVSCMHTSATVSCSLLNQDHYLPTLDKKA